MSLALTVPKGYKINSKGKLVRRKKIRILRILTSKGLDTHYDGYFGVLPEGVFKYIFQIATEMLENEKKVEWEKRLTWSHQDGDRTYKFLGFNFRRGDCLVRQYADMAETGDLIHAEHSYGGDHPDGWWRVHKTTDKTISLRRLEVKHDPVAKKQIKAATGEDPMNYKHTSNSGVPHQSCYFKLTGKYEKMPNFSAMMIDPFTMKKRSQLEFNAIEKMYRAKVEAKLHKTKPLPAYWRDAKLRFFKNKEAKLLDGTRRVRLGHKVSDLAERWVEVYSGEQRSRRHFRATALSKGFNC